MSDNASPIGRAVGWGLAGALTVLAVVLVADSRAGFEATVPGTAGQATQHAGSQLLATLAYAAPPWIGTAINLLAIGIFALAAVGYYRSDPDVETLIMESGEQVLTVIAAMAAAHLLLGQTALPYAGEIVAAGVGGWIGTKLLIRGIEAATERSGPSDPSMTAPTTERAREAGGSDNGDINDAD